MIEPRKHLQDIYRSSNQEPSRLFKQRLDRNERNQPFSPEFVAKIREKISGEMFMTYPEPGPIYDKMADWLGVGREKIMLHLGSEQVIKTVFETYINPADKLLLHFPGFAMYEVYGKLFQADILQQEYDSELRFDWDEYTDKIRTGLRMVVVENPNGFLGLSVSLDTLRAILEKARKHSVIALVDEAYFHFHEDTVIHWMDEFDNLILTRTFSKALGLAGLRVGYLVSRPENIANLMKVRPAYEITSVTALVVNELLDHLDEMEKYVEDTKRDLAIFRESLAELGVDTSDSKANFVAARLGKEGIHDALRNALREKDILIRRPFREPELREWVRISSAPPHVLSTLLENLRRILGKNSKG